MMNIEIKHKCVFTIKQLEGELCMKRIAALFSAFTVLFSSLFCGVYADEEIGDVVMVVEYVLPEKYVTESVKIGEMFATRMSEDIYANKYCALLEGIVLDEDDFFSESIYVQCVDVQTAEEALFATNGYFITGTEGISAFLIREETNETIQDVVVSTYSPSDFSVLYPDVLLDRQSSLSDRGIVEINGESLSVNESADTSIESEAEEIALPEEWILPWGYSIAIDGVSVANHTYSDKNLALEFSRASSCDIYAPCDGVLFRYSAPRSSLSDDEMEAYGYYVMFRPDDMDAFVIMGHLESLSDSLVARFESYDFQLYAGEYIGQMGSTGHASNTQLHFEVTVPESSVTSLFEQPVSEWLAYSPVNVEEEPLESADSPADVSIEDSAQYTGENMILSARAENPKVKQGETVLFSVQTTQDVRYIELINEYGEPVGKQNKPESSEGGVQSWRVTWRSRGGPDRKILVRAYYDGGYEDTEPFGVTVVQGGSTGQTSTSSSEQGGTVKYQHTPPPVNHPQRGGSTM